MREIKGKSHGESSIPSLLIRNISKWTQFPAVLMSSGLFLSFTYWIILRNAYHLTFYYTFTNISSTPGFQQWLQPRKTKGNGFPWPQTQSPSMWDCKGGHGMLPPSGRSWLPVKCRGTFFHGGFSRNCRSWCFRHWSNPAIPFDHQACLWATNLTPQSISETFAFLLYPSGPLCALYSFHSLTGLPFPGFCPLVGLSVDGLASSCWPNCLAPLRWFWPSPPFLDHKFRFTFQLYCF